jgi:hypothetical protein
MGKFPVKFFELVGNFYKKFQNGGKIFKHFQISGNISKVWKLTFSPGSWHESRLNRGGYKYMSSLLFFPRSATSLDDELDECTCTETNCCRRTLSPRSVVYRGHCCCPSCTAPWYISNVSIIFDAPCLFLHHLPCVSLHFVAFLCDFRN